MSPRDITDIETRLRGLGDDLPEVSRMFKARLATAATRAIVAKRRRAELPRLHLLAVSMVVAGLLGSRAGDLPKVAPSQVTVAGVRAGRPEAGNWWTRSVPSQPIDPLGSDPGPGADRDWELVEVALLDRDDMSRVLIESEPLRRKAGWRAWAHNPETA